MKTLQFSQRLACGCAADAEAVGDHGFGQPRTVNDDAIGDVRSQKIAGSAVQAGRDSGRGALHRSPLSLSVSLPTSDRF